MKKFLLSALTSVCFILGAGAQEISVTVEGQPIENGAEITATNYDPVLLNFGTLALTPEVVATVDEETNLVVKVTNIGQENQVQICWPSNCQFIPVGNFLEVTGNVDANTPTDMLIDCNIFPFDPTKAYSATCLVEMGVEGLLENNTFAFTLIMKYDPDENGVDTVITDGDAPVIYFDLMGRRVSNPTKGQIVIMRRGGTVSKLIY